MSGPPAGAFTAADPEPGVRRTDPPPPDDGAPDPGYACALLVSPGLAAAAARCPAAIERGDGFVRVLGATVRREGEALTCDCPMGKAPACLHRVVADAWARGRRAAGEHGAASLLAGAAGLEGTSQPALAPADEPRRRTGERLPQEDVARFEPLLARAEALGAELVTFGLQRASAGTLERLDGLVLAARTAGVRAGAPRDAGLGRVARALGRLRRALGELLDRLVTTTELDVLRELAVLRNLTRALRANTGALPLSDFAGATQEAYAEVPALDAQGLGLEAWVTPAGFAGVTVYVADLRTGRVLTRTSTLPAELAEQAPAQGYRSTSWAERMAAEPAFAGSPVSLLDLARGRFLLSGALVAPGAGRLSGSGRTQLAGRAVVGLDDARLRPSALLGAVDAVRLARRLGFDPLGRPPASPPVALVPVAALQAGRFDRLTQTLRLGFTTRDGGRLGCALTYRDERALWLDNLEALCRAAPPPHTLLVRLGLEGRGIVALPLTAYFATGGPCHLTLRPLGVPLRAAPAAEARP